MHASNPCSSERDVCLSHNLQSHYDNYFAQLERARKRKGWLAGENGTKRAKAPSAGLADSYQEALSPFGGNAQLRAETGRTGCGWLRVPQAPLTQPSLRAEQEVQPRELNLELTHPACLSHRPACVDRAIEDDQASSSQGRRRPHSTTERIARFLNLGERRRKLPGT